MNLKESSLSTCFCRGGVVSVCPEVQDELFCLGRVEFQIVGLAPLFQAQDLIPVCRLILACYPSHHGCVICKYDDDVLGVGRSPIQGVQ